MNARPVIQHYLLIVTRNGVVDERGAFPSPPSHWLVIWNGSAVSLNAP